MATSSSKVLVVEDDVQLLGLIRRSLEDDGAEVRSAGTGAEAMRVLRDEGDTFDLVVLDLVLPLVNGLEILAALRSAPATRNVPVLITTGTMVYSHQFAREKPVAILRKPFDHEQLLAAVHTLIYAHPVSHSADYRAADGERP